jgi:hypothetical protein
MEDDFRFVPRKVPFPFSECRNWLFFCEAATETRYLKDRTTPHINNRPPGVRVTSLILLREPSSYILDFVQATADFVGTGWVCTLAVIQ